MIMSNCWHDKEEITRLKFKDVFPTDVEFINAIGYNNPDELYDGSSKITPVLTEDQTVQCYYLLYGEYYNSTFKSTVKEIIINRVATIVSNYAAVWAREKELLKNIRNLTEDEITDGQTVIINNAYNPSIEPSTQTTEELNYIDSQNVNKNKKSKINAYLEYKELLKTEKDEWLVNKFKVLFISFPKINVEGYYE